jgi:hypothetical protein
LLELQGNVDEELVVTAVGNSPTSERPVASVVQ